MRYECIQRSSGLREGADPVSPTKKGPPPFSCVYPYDRHVHASQSLLLERKVCLQTLLNYIGRPDDSISLVLYLILKRNNYYTYSFYLKTGQLFKSNECKAKPRSRTHQLTSLGLFITGRFCVCLTQGCSGGYAWERRTHSFSRFCFKLSLKLFQNSQIFCVGSHIFFVSTTSLALLRFAQVAHEKHIQQATICYSFGVHVH